MASTILDRQDFDKKVEEAGEKLVIIDFFATWCGPCKMISPKLEELANQYAEKAAVFKVDVDTCEDLANEYNVTLMPTFVFMKNKNVLEVFVGGNTEKLVESMERLIGANLEQNGVVEQPPTTPTTPAKAFEDAPPSPDILADHIKDLNLSDLKGEEIKIEEATSEEGNQEASDSKPKSSKVYKMEKKVEAGAKKDSIQRCKPIVPKGSNVPLPKTSKAQELKPTKVGSKTSQADK